jgi:peroxiredoxin
MKRSFFLFLLTASMLSGAGELSHRRAPGFSLVDAAMQEHDLGDYHGKYVVIEIMQTTCPHCIKFAEIIEKAMIKYRGKVAALSIVIPPDNLTAVSAYIKKYNITIPVLFDCGQVTASYLKIGPSNPRVNFPHAFIVDPNGNLVNDWEYGPGTESIFEGDGLAAELDKLLSGKK